MAGKTPQVWRLLSPAALLLAAEHPAERILVGWVGPRPKESKPHQANTAGALRCQLVNHRLKRPRRRSLYGVAIGARANGGKGQTLDVIFVTARTSYLHASSSTLAHGGKVNTLGGEGLPLLPICISFCYGV